MESINLRTETVIIVHKKGLNNFIDDWFVMGYWWQIRLCFLSNLRDEC